MVPTDNSPLINYALDGLQRCWLPQHGRWSHIYHLDGREPPNESLPHSDVFYTINVLLGLSRVPQVPRRIDLSEIFRRNVDQLIALPVRKYTFGVTLWASAELGLELPGEVSQHIDEMLANKEQWGRFYAQDLGMILIGVVAQAKHDPKKWSHLAAELFAFLVDRYRCQSGLFSDATFGLRRRYASFASQTYLTLASYFYGELASDDRAIRMANASTSKLIALQGPNGEWPWFFDAPNGKVVDFYEVYSVHQYGMAPAFLECAARCGVSEARGALVKGFKWALGENQLSMPMFVPALNLSLRSQVRRGELHTKWWRAFRAIRNSLLRRSSDLIEPKNLQLRLECRSYELGWILWSFGRRTDLPELTHHKIFTTQSSRSSEQFHNQSRSVCVRTIPGDPLV